MEASVGRPTRQIPSTTSLRGIGTSEQSISKAIGRAMTNAATSLRRLGWFEVAQIHGSIAVARCAVGWCRTGQSLLPKERPTPKINPNSRDSGVVLGRTWIGDRGPLLGGTMPVSIQGWRARQ